VLVGVGVGEEIALAVVELIRIQHLLRLIRLIDYQLGFVFEYSVIVILRVVGFDHHFCLEGLVRPEVTSRVKRPRGLLIIASFKNLRSLYLVVIFLSDPSLSVNAYLGRFVDVDADVLLLHGPAGPLHVIVHWRLCQVVGAHRPRRVVS